VTSYTYRTRMHGNIARSRASEWRTGRSDGSVVGFWTPCGDSSFAKIILIFHTSESECDWLYVTRDVIAGVLHCKGPGYLQTNASVLCAKRVSISKLSEWFRGSYCNPSSLCQRAYMSFSKNCSCIERRLGYQRHASIQLMHMHNA
jgi:hypothetical protein